MFVNIGEKLIPFTSFALLLTTGVNCKFFIDV